MGVDDAVMVVSTVVGAGVVVVAVVLVAVVVVAVVVVAVVVVAVVVVGVSVCDGIPPGAIFQRTSNNCDFLGPFFSTSGSAPRCNNKAFTCLTRKALEHCCWLLSCLAIISLASSKSTLVWTVSELGYH